MAIPSRQIGWSTEDNLLWQISKQLEQLTNVTAKGCTTTTTTTTLPVYRVYTALLTQYGGDVVKEKTQGDSLDLGITYLIDVNSENADLTIFGAPNSNVGTYFVCTNAGTLPLTGSISLVWNEGAPIVTVLENTIGNIWFSYKSAGVYRCYSDDLFTINKTTVFISDTVNGKSDNSVDLLTMRVLCSLDTGAQPSYLGIYTGTASGSYEDSIITPTSDLEYAVTFEIRVYN